MHCARRAASRAGEIAGIINPGQIIPINMMYTTRIIPSFKILARLRHKAAIDRTAVIYIPPGPNSASEAATMKNIKNSVDNWNCIGKTISTYRIAVRKHEIKNKNAPFHHERSKYRKHEI
ncbi:MAG: hypothetical protein ABSA26_05920 [Thermoguttaceae bacterium]